MLLKLVKVYFIFTSYDNIVVCLTPRTSDNPYLARPLGKQESCVCFIRWEVI